MVNVCTIVEPLPLKLPEMPVTDAVVHWKVVPTLEVKSILVVCPEQSGEIFGVA